MTEDDIRTSYRKHAALAQFYRWYQLYENPAVPLANQLEILAPDVVVRSGLGEARGHDAYSARIAQLPKTWNNAHWVTSTVVTPLADGGTRLEAGVTYLNEGMKPGIIRSADLTYRMQLGAGAPLLPQFQIIEIQQNSETTAPTFTVAYPDNRARSLVHDWLASIENPARDIAPFREILADGFLLNFSSGPIHDFSGLEAWYRGPGSAVAASAHLLKDFSCEGLSDGEWRVRFAFDWDGILPDGTRLEAETRHIWLVQDDPQKRFAQIKRIDVELVRPFAPKKS
jgi:hypothetical protein